jgi:hypothetical protein
MRKLLIIALILNSFKLLAYQPTDNIEKLQKNSLELSNLIFLGELLSSDSIAQKATFIIFEKYKGVYDSDTISVRYSWQEGIGFRHYDGLWLVYATKADKYNDSNYYFCRTDISRSLQHPENLFIWTYIKKLDNPKYDRNSARIDAVSDWYLEKEKLKRQKQSETTIKKDNSFEKLITLSIILSVLNFLILIYIMTNLKFVNE